jgi:hypothetical protein
MTGHASSAAYVQEGGGHLSRIQKGKSFTAITIRRDNGYEVIRVIIIRSDYGPYMAKEIS